MFGNINKKYQGINIHIFYMCSVEHDFILRLDSNTQTLIYDAKICFAVERRRFLLLFDYEKYIFFNATKITDLCVVVCKANKIM